MPHKILIVDDEEDMQGALRKALEARGHRVAVCGNGLDVVAAICDYRPDLMILDVMLPGLDGYSLITKLSTEPGPELRSLPVVVISALEPASCMFQNFPQVAAFLSKPFDLEEIVRAVDSALIKKAPPGES